MKVKTKELQNFLNKALMSGAQTITEGVLDFEKDGLKINANDKLKTARTISWLNRSCFVDYPEAGIGKVCLNELTKANEILKRFGDLIELKKEGNLLSVSGDVGGRKKSVDIELVSETFLETDAKEPTLDFDQTFNMSASAMSDILSDVKVNKDAFLTLTTKDKFVEFTNTGKYKFTNNVIAPTVKEGVSVSLGEPFMNAVNNLDGEIQLSIKSDYPIKIMEKTESSIITLIVAPRVEKE